jgi:glutathionylspermidine synthase
MRAVERIIERKEMDRLRIAKEAQEVIEWAWDADPPAIYGRFDLAYNGQDAPKMLEYNADTPTSLLEAAVIQWHWLQDVDPEKDQFNLIWEKLVKKWRDLRGEGYLKSNLVHFACQDVPEDIMTTAVLMDTASEAGVQVVLLQMHEIGWNEDLCRFVDLNETPMDTLFKLYPWEWAITDPFGVHALQTYREMQWVAPIWKMVVSNKGILPILWEMFPDSPYLLPAYFDEPRDLKEFVSKPLLGREGANCTIVREGITTKEPGPYEDSGFVFQQYTQLPEFDGNHAVIGSWVIDCDASGIGVRESDGPITTDFARFVPHYFEPMEKKS